MSKLSCSFTLGKASAPNNANLEHNNRETLADNIDVARIGNNITYIQKDVRETYNELFGEALAEYNAKQTRAHRKIEDYYEHIENCRWEEAFYEVIIQYGDIDSAPVGSYDGELAVKMLHEYIMNFIERNKNLHVFSAALHLDETYPHAHIDFIPFYTEGRKNGLSKGVSILACCQVGRKILFHRTHIRILTQLSHIKIRLYAYL